MGQRFVAVEGKFSRFLCSLLVASGRGPPREKVRSRPVFTRGEMNKLLLHLIVLPSNTGLLEHFAVRPRIRVGPNFAKRTPEAATRAEAFAQGRRACVIGL